MNLPFHKSSCHLAKFPFHQLSIWSTSHFISVNVSFSQLAISSTFSKGLISLSYSTEPPPHLTRYFSSARTPKKKKVLYMTLRQRAKATSDLMTIGHFYSLCIKLKALNSIRLDQVRLSWFSLD